MSLLQIKRVDYLNAQDAQALVFLLDAYAQDPMGGGDALHPEAAARLCSDLARIAGAASFIAWLDDKPLGLINCFEGYSTFKAKPLLNVHDIAVLAGHRGQKPRTEGHPTRCRHKHLELQSAGLLVKIHGQQCGG